MNAPAAKPPNALGRRFTAWLAQPQLPLQLALIATLLTLPTLALGFHLDDHVHRFLFSGLPGSAELLRAYESPFGIANGEPAVNHWQVEAGYAPYWIHPDLLISLLRPVSTLSHRIDAAFWPASAPLQHAHSLMWHFALLLAAGLLYRGLLGSGTVAGLAALFYAFDHTHGFALGWIANRNAFIAGAFGVASLLCYVRGRALPARPLLLLLSAILFGCALFAGEGAIAIFGYLLGFALFLDREPGRFLWLAPHLLVFGGWRVAYALFDRGARYSGLYIDPVREPLRFLLAALERIPVLVLGQFGLPPAEAHVFAPPPLPGLIVALGVLVCALLLYAALPLLRSDGRARFFAFGMLAALVPACTTHPNNRLLVFVGIGAMGLLSQLWHAHVARAATGLLARAARAIVGLATGFHLIISPLLLPFTALSIALTSQAEAATESALDGSAGRELVIVTSPDYYYVKLVPIVAALDGRPAPRRLRALAFGELPVRVTRTGPAELELFYEGGLLASPLLELYRARDLPMPIGTRVDLDGLRITVTALTPDGRVERARFAFTAPLEDARYDFRQWDGARYAPFVPPAAGQSSLLRPGGVRLGL